MSSDFSEQEFWDVVLALRFKAADSARVGRLLADPLAKQPEAAARLSAEADRLSKLADRLQVLTSEPSSSGSGLDAQLEAMQAELTAFVQRWATLQRGAGVAGALFAASVELMIECGQCQPNIRSVLAFCRELGHAALRGRVERLENLS